MKSKHLAPQLVASFLIMALCLPSPAFALRQVGLEETGDNPDSSKNSKMQLVSALQGVPATVASSGNRGQFPGGQFPGDLFVPKSPAGLEERKRGYDDYRLKATIEQEDRMELRARRSPAYLWTAFSKLSSEVQRGAPFDEALANRDFLIKATNQFSPSAHEFPPDAVRTLFGVAQGQSLTDTQLAHLRVSDMVMQAIALAATQRAPADPTVQDVFAALDQLFESHHIRSVPEIEPFIERALVFTGYAPAAGLEEVDEFVKSLRNLATSVQPIEPPSSFERPIVVSASRVIYQGKDTGIANIPQHLRDFLTANRYLNEFLFDLAPGNDQAWEAVRHLLRPEGLSKFSAAVKAAALTDPNWHGKKWKFYDPSLRFLRWRIRRDDMQWVDVTFSKDDYEYRHPNILTDDDVYEVEVPPEFPSHHVSETEIRSRIQQVPKEAINLVQALSPDKIEKFRAWLAAEIIEENKRLQVSWGSEYATADIPKFTPPPTIRDLARFHLKTFFLDMDEGVISIDGGNLVAKPLRPSIVQVGQEPGILRVFSGRRADNQAVSGEYTEPPYVFSSMDTVEPAGLSSILAVLGRLNNSSTPRPVKEYIQRVGYGPLLVALLAERKKKSVPGTEGTGSRGESRPAGLEELPQPVERLVTDLAGGQENIRQENLGLMREILGLPPGDPLRGATGLNFGELLLGIQRHQRSAPKTIPPPMDPDAPHGLSSLRSFPGSLPVGSLGVLFRPSRDTREVKYPESTSPSRKRCNLCEKTVRINFPGLRRFHWRSFKIWPNPAPTFEDHITLAWETHRKQQVHRAEIRDLLDFLFLAPQYRVFYNGPKVGASIGKHQHFQGITPPLPVEGIKLERRLERGPVRISTALGYPAQVIVLESRALDELADAAQKLLEFLDREEGENKIAGYNLLLTPPSKEGSVRIFVFPRHAYQSQTAKKRFKVGGIGSIEMGGFMVTGDRDTYDTLSGEDVKAMLREVSVSPEELKQILDASLGSGLEEQGIFRVQNGVLRGVNGQAVPAIKGIEDLPANAWLVRAAGGLEETHVIVVDSTLKAGTPHWMKPLAVLFLTLQEIEQAFREGSLLVSKKDLAIVNGENAAAVEKIQVLMKANSNSPATVFLAIPRLFPNLEKSQAAALWTLASQMPEGVRVGYVGELVSEGQRYFVFA